MKNYAHLQNQLMVNWWFGFLGSPYERDCYIGVPRVESQRTNLNHRFTISWHRITSPSTSLLRGHRNHPKHPQTAPSLLSPVQLEESAMAETPRVKQLQKVIKLCPVFIWSVLICFPLIQHNSSQGRILAKLSMSRHSHFGELVNQW